MLRIVVSTSSAKAKFYYTASLSKGDYYTEGLETIGVWSGRGAAKLGLKGNVDQASFGALCDNLDPHTHERLTLRQKEKRRIGYDFNLHCPKSVSLLHAVSNDPKIVAAFRSAVSDTMHEMESLAATRVRKGNANFARTTGSMVWAEFVHLTSRPVDGTPDPHLHAHLFAFNATFDNEENRWKAADFGEIKRNAPYFEAGFLNRLARNLRTLGYVTERRGKSFEIVGVPHSALLKVSRRTREIEQLAKKLGITDKKAKSKLGALTRKPKTKKFTHDELRKILAGELAAEELAEIRQTIINARDELRKHEHRLEHPPQRALKTSLALGTQKRYPQQFQSTPRVSEADALNYSLKFHFERSSVMEEKRLLETAIRYGVGLVDSDRLRTELSQRLAAGAILANEKDGRRMITTREVLAEEQFIIGWSKGTAAPLAPRHVVKNDILNDEQRRAVQHVLSADAKVVLIVGRAGVGKTTLMHEAIQGIDATGRPVVVLTPNSEHAYDRLRADGFKDAQTVERFLVDENLRGKYQGSVIWVDEGGLLSSRSMYRLFKAADELNARVVLSGDPGQHRPVERGDAMQILLDQAKLPVVALENIQRQKGIYREAVEHLASGRVAEGFSVLDRMGAIVELDSGERYKLLAKEYVKAVEAGHPTLVVSPTHAEGRKVTEEIRELKKANGQLQKEIVYPVLRRIELNDAQRGDFREYRPGWIIQLNQNTETHAKGERLEVVAAGDPALNRFFVRDSQGTISPLNVKTSSHRLHVFEKSTLPLAEGDRIRVTQGGETLEGHKLTNGSLHTVIGITEAGNLKIDKGIIANDYAHVLHGYCSTSIASQGRNVRNVIIAQSSESGAAADMRQFYVSVSRGKENITIYTDDKTVLLETVQSSHQRMSATELMTPDKKHEPPALDREAELRLAQRRAEATPRIPTKRQLGQHPQRNAASIGISDDLLQRRIRKFIYFS